MIAYSKTLLEAFKTCNTSEIWSKKAYISKDSLDKIHQHYSSEFYSPNIFIRILLFIFMVILVVATMGFFSLFVLGSNLGQAGIGVLLLIYAAGILAVLEILVISGKKAYRAGMDDALTYIALGLIITSIFLFVDEMQYQYEYNEFRLMITVLSVSFPLICFFALRYVDRLLFALAFACFFWIVFIGFSEMGTTAKSILPFVVMILSAAFYIVKKKIEKNDTLVWWEEGLMVIEILSLLTFYLSGNYFVVRELTEMMFEISFEPGTDIPFAYIFYAFTVVVPAVYIYLGLKNKDRVMLLAGLAILGMAVFTFKYYFSLGHHEISLTIGGLILTGIAAWGMKYLKQEPYGFTSREDIGVKVINSDAEALVMAETFKESVQERDNFDFGGGQYGGGGAGGKY